jgi:hypothetical protein
MIRTFQLVLSGTPKRLSDVYGGTAGVPDETKNIPYRQLFFTVAGADAFMGQDNTVSPTNWGVAATISGPSMGRGVIGPFETGPVKLSDFWVVGVGATIHILGVPF